MKSNFEQTDSVIKYFNKLKPNKLGKYLLGFQKRLNDEIKDFQIDIEFFNIETIEQNLSILNKYPELEKAIISFICKLLEFPIGLNTTEEEIEIRYFNIRKASSHLSYYRIKAIENIFEKEEATKLYKEIAKYLIKERKEQNPPEIPEDPRKVTRIESRERIMK